MASDEGLSRDESRKMRDIGRQAMSQVVGVALKQAVSHDLLRTFAVVSKVNGDGTVDLECGSEETPMPLNGVRLTLGCSTVQVGDTVVVDTYDHSPLVVSVLYSNASSGHTVASKPAVDKASEAAASAKESADAATESAKTAQSKADAATESAATAQTKADTASTAAATAQSKAEDATASANAAGRAASNAQAAAEAAQGDIDSQRTYFWHDSDGSHVLGEQDGYRSDVRADGLHVLSARDSSELAKFTASGSQLGADNKAHQSMDYHSWRLVDADGNAFAHVSDLRDENGEYDAVDISTLIFTANKPTAAVHLSYPPKRVTSVMLVEYVSDAYPSDSAQIKSAPVEYTVETSKLNQVYTGTDIPEKFVACTSEAIQSAADKAGFGAGVEANVVVKYKTDDRRLKAFTFGNRVASNSFSIGPSSLVAGIDNEASGVASIALGYANKSNQSFSATIGTHLTASEWYQTVVGRNNAEANGKAFVVGNGDVSYVPNDTSTKPSNAFTVDWSGNGEFQGGMTLGTPLPVASGGTGANTASEAFKNLSGYTLDLGTNNTYDTWVPVMTNNSTIQHRVLPALPLPVSAGGTGATDAAGARANLGLYQNPATIGDCNSAPAGFSFYTTGTANRPTDFGHLITFDGANWKFQIALGTYGGMWWRQNINNGGWTKWSQLANNPTSTSYYYLTPVYRLYNQYNGQHLFVSSESEYNSLVSQGWTGEGIVFYAFK